MAQGLRDLELIKTRAAFWNGLAIATIVVGVLPLLISLETAADNIGAFILRVFGTGILAGWLSYLFRLVAARVLSEIEQS